MSDNAGSSLSQKRRSAVYAAEWPSSDDDFQQTLYNKRSTKRRKLTKTKTAKTRVTDRADNRANQENPDVNPDVTYNAVETAEKDQPEDVPSSARTGGPEAGPVKQRKKTVGRPRKTPGKRSQIRTTKGKENRGGADVTSVTRAARVILQRLDVKPGITYQISTRQQTLRKKRQELRMKTLEERPGRHAYQKSLISLPHVDNMHKYSSADALADETIHTHGKRNICDVIDSSDDETILIRGKPNRKKTKKDALSDSWLETFYMSSSDESILNSCSDEDIFASSGEEDGADAAVKGGVPDDRMLRLLKRRTLQCF